MNSSPNIRLYRRYHRTLREGFSGATGQTGAQNLHERISPGDIQDDLEQVLVPPELWRLIPVSRRAAQKQARLECDVKVIADTIPVIRHESHRGMMNDTHLQKLLILRTLQACISHNDGSRVPINAFGRLTT